MFCVCLFTAFEYLVIVSCLSETKTYLGKVPSDIGIKGEMKCAKQVCIVKMCPFLSAGKQGGGKWSTHFCSNANRMRSQASSMSLRSTSNFSFSNCTSEEACQERGKVFPFKFIRIQDN